MRIAAIIVALAATAASAAHAQPGRLTDVEYLQAARCAGLAEAGIGGADAASINALMKAEGRGRAGFIADKAEATRAQVMRQANRASTERKAGFAAELAGACQRFIG
jgi:hypothetical protein